MKNPRRRLIGGLIAVLAIVAGSVGAGAFVAQAQPNSVTIDLVDGSNIVGPYFIQGSVSWSNTAGGTVAVAVTGPSGSNVYCSETSYPATATSWSCPSASLEYGQNTVVVTATESTDLENPRTATVTVTRGSTQPATISSPADGVVGTASTSFSGTGAHMGTVTLQARPASAPPTAFADVCPPVAVGEDGVWNCDATFPGPDSYVVRALGTLLGGLDGGDSTEQTYHVVSFGISSPADESVIDWSSTGTEFSGSTSITESATVRVYDWAAESLLCTATVTAGAWACASDVPLPMGTRDYTAEQTAPTYQVNTTVSVTVRPGVPGYTTGNPVIIEGGTVLFEGTTTAPNVWVTVGIDGIGSCSTPTPVENPGDSWSCSIDDMPFAPAGTYPIDVYQTYQPLELQGAITTATLTISPGPALEITSPLEGDDIDWAADAFFVVSGSSPASAPVDVYLDGDLETPVCSLGSVDGTWYCPGIAIDPGPHTLTARQEGEDDAVVGFDILLPAPDLPSEFTFEPGTTDAPITGTRAYVASTRVTVFENIGEGTAGEPLATTTCAGGPVGSTFSCVVDLSALPAGPYIVEAEHFLADQPGVLARTTQTFLYIEPSGPVTLDCAFVPSGVTISTTGPASVSIYTLEALADDSGWSLAPQGYCSGSSGYHDASIPSWNYTPYGGGEGGLQCDTGCTLSDLAPGIYEVYYSDYSAGGEGEGNFDYLFRIPETPTAVAASSGNSIALSGVATAGDTVRVVANSGTTLCETTATTGGTWLCGFTASTQTTARAISIDPQSGGMSAYSASQSIPTFVAPPAPPVTPVTPPTLPTLPDTPVTPALVQWLLSFDGDLMNLKPGDTFSATIAGMPEGWTIEVIMHSTPRSLGTTTATGETVTMELTVPDDIESGPHRIEVVATTPLGTNYYENADAQVIGGVTPVDEPVEEPAGNEEGVSGTTGPGGSADRSDPAAPSALTGSLATLAQIVANPMTVAIAGGLALALLILVALPTELLNNSLSSNSSRLGRVYGAIDRGMTRAQDWLVRFTRSRAAAAGLLVVVVAVIYGFVDPGFGFDVVSLRLVLSLAIAFFMLSFVASWISGVIIRRAWGAISVVAMQPTIILFAVIGVIVARVLEFSPGFLVGVAIGLELIQASKRVSARAVFVQLGVVTALALVAWIVYSFFEPGNDFVGLLVEDSLVALTAEGLTGALIAVFPLTFLDGRELWEVSKRLWVAAFLLVATAFALLVLPTAIEGTEVSDYGVWLIVFAVFGLISLAVWFVFARAAKRAAAAERQKVDA